MAATAAASDSSMVVDGFAMVVNLSLGFIDGGRWVFNSGQWLVDLVVEGGAWQCELEIWVFFMGFCCHLFNLWVFFLLQFGLI